MKLRLARLLRVYANRLDPPSHKPIYWTSATTATANVTTPWTFPGSGDGRKT